MKAGTVHYVRTTDTAVLQQAGAADAAAGSTFVVLDLGAQSNDRSGVVLSATSTKITYSTARSLVQAYLAGYAGASSQQVTVAVATNNDGAFSPYYATARGSDWATKMVESLRSSSTTPSTTAVVGADDIEPDGSSTESQAQTWEDYYLSAAAAAGDTSSRLYFVGSADGCPTGFGQTGRTCDYTWTQAQLYRLAGGSGTGRIRALPQVYLRDQAVQWADIAATGGGTGGFVGALTEHATCPTAGTSGCTFASYTAPQGFAAMYHAMSTVAASPAVDQVTDLDVLS